MPKPIVLEPGVQYILGKGENQVGYQVLEMLAQGEMLVQNITEQGGKKLVHRQDMLRCCLFEGTLRFVLPGKSNLRENVSTLRTADGRALKTSYDFSVLSDLPTKIQDITRQRFELVKRILSLRPDERTKDNVEVEITTFLDELIKAKGRDGIPDLLGNHIGKGTGLRKKKDMQSSIIESTQTSAVKAYNIPTCTGKYAAGWRILSKVAVMFGASFLNITKMVLSASIYILRYRMWSREQSKRSVKRTMIRPP